MVNYQMRLTCCSTIRTAVCDSHAARPQGRLVWEQLDQNDGRMQASRPEGTLIKHVHEITQVKHAHEVALVKQAHEATLVKYALYWPRQAEMTFL
jgi:hypothetical protein